jgi:hypothetical protein
VFVQHLRRERGKQIERRQEGGFLLDDALDGEIGNGEF